MSTRPTPAVDSVPEAAKEEPYEIVTPEGAIITNRGKLAADARGIIPNHPLMEVLGIDDVEYVDELRAEIAKYKREVDEREFGTE